MLLNITPLSLVANGANERTKFNVQWSIVCQQVATNSETKLRNFESTQTHTSSVYTHDRTKQQLTLVADPRVVAKLT